MADYKSTSPPTVPVGADGQLSGGTSTATGGKGSLSIDGATNQTAATDGLISRSSLTVAGHVGTCVVQNRMRSLTCL